MSLRQGLVSNDASYTTQHQWSIHQFVLSHVNDNFQNLTCTACNNNCMHLIVNSTGYSIDLSMQQQTCKQFTAWTEYLKQFISMSMHSHGNHLQRRKGTHILQPMTTAYTDTISMTTETCYYASSDDRVHSRVATNVNRCESIPRYVATWT